METKKPSFAISSLLFLCLFTACEPSNDAATDSPLQLKNQALLSPITVDYMVIAKSNQQFEAFMTINNRGTYLNNWVFEFGFNPTLDTIKNATLESVSNHIYSVTGTEWTKDIPENSRLSFSFIASKGTASQLPYSCKINGIPCTFQFLTPSPDTPTDPTSPDDTQPTPSPTHNPEPTPSPSSSGTPLPTPTPDANAPAKPALYINPVENTITHTYDLSIEWDIWWGNNATFWQLYEQIGTRPETLISSNSLEDHSPNPQQVKLSLPGRPAGTYNYRILLKNATGLTSETAIQVTPGTWDDPSSHKPVAPTILIDGIDTDAQAANQIYLELGQLKQIQLVEKEIKNQKYEITFTDSALLSTSYSSENGLISLQGSTPGRTSMQIKNPTTGNVRTIGVTVKNADGTAPGLPNYLAMGSVSQDDSAAVSFWQDIHSDNRNKRMDIRYIYLNDGPGPNGWASWLGGNGKRATQFVNNSLTFGMMPFFVYYNINNGQDSLESITKNVNDATFMEEYYKNLKLAVTLAQDAAGISPVGFLIEPDFLGYVLQSGQTNPKSFRTKTSSVYTSGVLERGKNCDPQKPDFEENLNGLVQSINCVIRHYAPQAYLGWQLNLWGNPHFNGGSGIVHATDGAVDIQTAKASIQTNASELMDFGMSAGITYLANFVSIDKYGLDGAQQLSAPENPEKSIWFWNADHWNNYLYFVSILHERSQLPIVLWQLPVGHINSSQATSTYTHQPFTDLNNTASKYEDSSPTYFLGDTFSDRTSIRSNTFFSVNRMQDPKIKVDTQKHTITWGSHTQEAVNAGAIAILFGAGVGVSTQGTPSPTNPDISIPTDDFWWISRIQDYYLNPTPLISK